MIDHVEITVPSFDSSKHFYQRLLSPLSITLTVDTLTPKSKRPNAGFGKAGTIGFWILGDANTTAGPTHVAFTAESRKSVDLFYSEGLAAGGVDKGAPELMPNIHEHYYAAFIADENGNLIEAACHKPEPSIN